MIFLNCIKNLSFENNQMFDVFKVARPVCSRLHFDLREHFTKKTNIYLQKRCFFAFLPQNEEVKDFFSKIPPNCCPYKCTNLGKSQFNIISALSEE